MEEPYIEGVAIHGDPESCVGAREGAGEAWTGACIGRAIEPRNHLVQGADVVLIGGRQHPRQRYGELPSVNADRKGERASLLHEWRCVLRKAS